MRIRFKYSILLLLVFVCNACIDIEEQSNDPKGNFEALWKIMDERYCFFQYKNIDWEKIHNDYAARLKYNMTEAELFDLLNEMLQELKDGHVNLSTPFNLGRYWKWFEDYPANFYPHLIENYLRTDYLMSGGIKYRILENNVGYMYYEDFSSGLGETNLDYIINKLAICEGIIIDVRNNGGGMLSNSDKLAARFLNEKTLVGYIQHKTGKGHNDFSEPFPKYVDPSLRLRYQKTVVVLTNRKCYSATNDFINAMRLFPNVTILGDKTGGGGGLPFTSELPNGWSVRLSACPMFDPNMQQIEFGIEPDIRMNLKEEDLQQGKDTYIEAACEFILNSK